MLKIGVLSDTHHRTKLHKEAIAHLLQEGAEYLLHAGDIGSKEHINMLQATQKPYRVVFGNNDHHLLALATTHQIYKEPYYFKIDTLKIKMMHLPYYMTPDVDLVISGHTHHFQAENINGTLFINPGEICAREKNATECLLLSVTTTEWVIDRFYRTIDAKKWESQRVVFKRVL